MRSDMYTTDDYIRKLEELYKGIEKYPSKKRHLTIPAIFGKSYHENFISKYLAHILDPAVNGIGNQPLKELLDPLFQEKDVYPSFNKVKVYTEHTFTNNNRRIDILIKIDDHIVVGIENKIFAVEDNKQTIRYRESLEMYYKSPKWMRFGIFLTRTGKKPVDEKLFKPLSYKDLLSRLECVNNDFTNDYRSRVLFDDFMDHIRDYIQENTMTESLSKRQQFFLANIGKYYEVQGGYIDSRKEVVRFLETQARMHDLFKNGGWEFRFETNENWQQIFKQNWKGVHLEFHFSDEHLKTGKIPLTVDIERDDKDLFIEYFKNIYKEKPDEWDKNDILICPQKRKFAVAYKYYDIDLKNEDKIEGGLKKVINVGLDEFRFMVDLIDESFRQLFH